MRAQIIFNVSDKIIKLGALFTTSIFAARLLDRDQYGIFVYVNVILSIAIAFSTSGIDTIIGKRISQDKKIDFHFIKNATIIKIIIAILASTVTYLYIKDRYSETSYAIALAAATTVVLAAIGYSEVVLTALQKNKLMLLLTITIIVPFGAIKLLALSHYEVPSVKYIIDSIEYFSLGISAMFFLRKLIFRSNSKEKTKFYFLVLLKECLPLWLNGIILITYSRYDQLFVGAIGTQGEMADYAIATQLNMIALILPTSVLTVAFPKMMALKDSDIYAYENLLVKLYRSLALYGFIWVAIVYLVGGIAVTTLYGQAYSGSINHLKILSVGVIFTILGQISGQWTVIEGKYWISVKRSIIGIFFMATANYIFNDARNITKVATITAINLFIVNILLYFILNDTKKAKELMLRAIFVNKKLGYEK
ncbi:oligosaccharide flippase family protein [Paucibacter sp. B2R-40]|uniref:oligosaccharide flippase family protein n=1 Tax=Paucibacter sp. B2R-40 TaxID=2893554 RepID=UPI0021E49899|nr:oligosaccharide flippase family protein [Paucibacter sp. B2R-40]MCV2354525.1 oligosaccharide flippase family protein [Paucibacter sp. B2R-40]